MTETLSLITERVDDLPLLLAQMQQLDLAEQIDAHLLPHGNRQGLSYGWLACVWLTHILSQADHRMNQVRGWVKQRLHTLQSLLPHPFVETDFTDDRLADLLRALSDDTDWEALETDLNRKSLAVYDLPTHVVRLDATTVSLDTDPEGLFQCGHSKDHRPDLAQVKMRLATLDPLAMPLLSRIVAGNSADDPLYLPAVEQVRKSLQKRGFLYVGDCKMAAKTTRASIASGQDFYLCPLAAVQMPAEEIVATCSPVTASGNCYKTSSVSRQTDKANSLPKAMSGPKPKRSPTSPGGSVACWCAPKPLPRLANGDWKPVWPRLNNKLPP